MSYWGTLEDENGDMPRSGRIALSLIVLAVSAALIAWHRGWV